MALLSVLVSGFVSSFVTVFLKGVQQKNVIHGLKKAAFVTSVFMAMADVAVVSLIAQNGWVMAIPCGTGAGLGMVLAMYTHDRFRRQNGGQEKEEGP